MKSVNQEIAEILQKDLALQKCLKRDLINTRSLARTLIEDHNLSYSIDAVISAIRRYDLETISLLSSQAQNAFKKMSITTKDNVTRLTLHDRAFTTIAQDTIAKKILKENIRLIKSKETITLLVSQKDIEKKIALFEKSDIINIQKNLTEIRLQFAQDITAIKGIVARVASELALCDINIEEIIYSMPDLLIYVREEDLVSAHKALLEIKNHNLSK